jgi:hypothetical protein
MAHAATYEVIAAAIRDARPISMDMKNIGVYAAHSALDQFVHSFADREINLNPRFDRARFCEATATPLNLSDR